MRLCTVVGIILGAAVPSVLAYVEAPYTLGRTCQESTNIVLVEVARVNKEKGLIIYKKLQDLKGKHPGTEIKHNIGKRGFHPREWQNVMNWAEVGKKAVFFHNGGASETCTGEYWYQCYREGDWWGMSHAEPFMLRTFCGNPEQLAGYVTAVVQGKEVVITCFADGPKEALHLRKGKVQRLKASLKLQDYNPKRDFAGWGGDGGEIVEFKTHVLLAESTPGWRFLPAAAAVVMGDRWRAFEFNDSTWRTGKAPIGYGEDEIKKRGGTFVKEEGVPFVFRRAFDVPADLLKQKDVTFRVAVASDDSAIVYLNGVEIDRDPVEDHEFAYWNREIELRPQRFRTGRNVIAAFVKNHKGSSDIYLDMEISAQTPVVRKLATKGPVTGALTPAPPQQPRRETTPAVSQPTPQAKQ